MDVMLPDGTRIRALPISERDEHDRERDFGLYMDERWQPSWPAETIAWADFGLPDDAETAAAQIESAFARARSGERVEIGCLGGLGRTGTVLACMVVLTGSSPRDAVEWVRSHYNEHAIERPEQEAWAEWFANHTRARASTRRT